MSTCIVVHCCEFPYVSSDLYDPWAFCHILHIHTFQQSFFLGGIAQLVVCLFMTLLFPICPKSLWAGGAHMWLFCSYMTLHVNFQMVFLEKSFVTDVTFNHISFQVNKCFMRQKLAFFLCFVWTIVTTEEQTLMGNSFVSSQGPRLSELFSILFTLMDERFLCVFSNRVLFW